METNWNKYNINAHNMATDLNVHTTGGINVHTVCPSVRMCTACVFDTLGSHSNIVADVGGD